MSAVDATFDDFFQRCSGGRSPYAYQGAVAARLFEGRHVELWAPTGAGKTLAVLAPFLWQLQRGNTPRWDRLLYVLPLRSLVESIAAEARRLVEEHLSRTDIAVTVQTGENPGDSFFSEGQVILTTYDQLLSGALEGPYGLPGMLHNINAAAVAGALVVFDEYHLMQPDQAFLTAVAHLEAYKALCQSVWMTATATTPLRDMLRDALNTTPVTVEPEELAQIPAVAQVTRRISVRDVPLTAQAVWDRHRSRSIVLVNRVARANELYDEFKRLAPDQHILLLHGLFLPEDRKRIEEEVRAAFGPGSEQRCILVCTQVIEAGMNISAEVLHTEAAPMSALVQRAGRCARFPGEAGDVLVYPLDQTSGGWALPYDEAEIEHSLTALAGLQDATLDASTMRDLVDAAHRAADGALLAEGWFTRQEEIEKRAQQTALLRNPATVSDLIRASDGQTVRVVIGSDPVSRRLNPYAVEGFSLRASALRHLFDGASQAVGWSWAPASEPEWEPLWEADAVRRAFAVCLSPEVATYTPERGLRLGEAGAFESPPRPWNRRSYSRPLHREPWARHAREVGAEAARLVKMTGGVLHEGLSQGPWELSPALLQEATRACGLLHDVGKLQVRWQAWAERAQRSLDPEYQHRAPLAHTDFNPEDPADREREKTVNEGGRRGPHAVASAWYSCVVVVALLKQAGEPVTKELRAACLAAMLGHHGAWLPRGRDTLDLDALDPRADEALAEATALDGLPALAPPRAMLPPRHHLEELLERATHPDVWHEWWPIVAYLTRTLRLADQRATSLYGGEE